jgi:hypothetical protein
MDDDRVAVVEEVLGGGQAKPVARAGDEDAGHEVLLLSGSIGDR